MPKLLVCWIGATDLRAAEGDATVGLGPIGQAVKQRAFDSIFLLNNYGREKNEPYRKWLGKQTTADISVLHRKLSSPMDFGDVYEAAVSLVQKAIERVRGGADLVYHLSPGTPVMAAVWVILSKTRYPAELIESSAQFGVKTTSVPFDISAEFIPDLLRKPDKELERLSAGLSGEASEFEDIIHQSPEMRRVIAMARRVAPRSIPVLIEGETGTGKELLARAIHRSSPRRHGPLVPVNCGAIAPELIESELFGHEKGAFTGADMQRKGHFEQASKGTLFLDEVGELPPPAQVKLLRALQESEIVRLGSSKPIKVDVRIICATNRNLIQEVAKGRFREDLFYRLAVAVIQLPPLRARRGDKGLLIEHLLNTINRESASEPGFKAKKLSPAAKNLLLGHDWPGNVREMINTLLRAAVWSSGDVIDAPDIKAALLPIQSGRVADILSKSLGEGFDLRKVLDEVEVHYLKRAMSEAQGNRTKAARLLGLRNYQTLSNWLARHGLGTNG